MQDTPRRVLGLLRAADDFLSGEEIGHRLEVSRAAANRLFAEEVAPLLSTKFIGRRLEYRGVVDSTNRAVADLARAGAAEGTVVVADAQTAGRGRMGRGWESPAGVNLYFSVVLRPQVLPARVPQLALAAGAGIHAGITSVCPGVSAAVKWPNDILASGRKLAGILCEAASEMDCVHFVVLGVGVNVNASSFPRGLRGIATSLRREGGAEVSRPRLLASILNNLEGRYLSWQSAGDLTGLLPYLEAYSALSGRRVVAEGPEGRVHGMVRGITPLGELLLETGAGALLRLEAGDVHLVPRGTPEPAPG